MEELTVEFNNVHVLYKCYMSFLKEGGLFVVTNRQYDLGHSLAINVLLPEEESHFVVTGKVAWLNPSASHSNAPQGIGIAFIDDKYNLKQRIETHLGPLLGSNEATYTL
ncbi:PilZ domain-containing protein [Catenovulum adriaticum]|uniref:PilZ domain-containing protein n=1 Tax=Catenovulum adriaticum TaxID=2984846 RepID=A0ABY7AN85_9ALTE|nr:PilZ domain-containing protein [Catenovulum sp. TS8]WAJ71023.1 PilZ domain-containing protein [Catenovulum sp. TS8]